LLYSLFGGGEKEEWHIEVKTTAKHKQRKSTVTLNLDIKPFVLLTGAITFQRNFVPDVAVLSSHNDQ
jgi:hypothetical protein